MRIKELIRNVFIAEFSNQKDLAETFLRFQEYFESPEFKNKIFTLDEYKGWFIKNTKSGKEAGKFTYYEDYAGFNIPSDILAPFFLGRFDPLSEKEKSFLDLFREYMPAKFYIIGVSKQTAPEIRKHETAHGLFYTNMQYRKEVQDTLNGLSQESKKIISDYLIADGTYHQDVFEDELHAYIMTLLPELEKEGINIKPFKQVAIKLNRIYRRFFEPMDETPEKENKGETEKKSEAEETEISENKQL
jgi:hypothetical protein